MSDSQKYLSIDSQSDLDYFVNWFGEFHDGLVKELHVINTSSVSKELSMGMANRYHIHALFQRQFEKPSATEIIFIRAHGITISHGAEIFEAKGTYTTQDNSDTPLIILEFDSGSITAERMFYRDASDWMGDEVRFGSTIPFGDGIPLELEEDPNY